MIARALGNAIPNVGFFDVFGYAITIIILVANSSVDRGNSHKIIVRMSERVMLACVFIIPTLSLN